MNDYVIPSLSKACQVLTWLANKRQGFSVSEIAREFDMPRTTAFRILRTLQAEGFIEEEGRKYRFGAELLRLGLLALKSVEIHDLAIPVLQDLVRATGETAHLAVRTGSQMLILEVADSPHPIRVASRPGTVVAIHCSATGKALLATLPVEEVRAILAGVSFDARTERTITTLEAFEAELDTVRRQGYAIDDEEYHMGVRCVGAAVFDARGKVAGALGITAATLRFAKRKIPAMAREVTLAAEALSRSLGLQVCDRSA